MTPLRGRPPGQPPGATVIRESMEMLGEIAKIR
jgi:hypothetical protein